MQTISLIVCVSLFYQPDIIRPNILLFTYYLFSDRLRNGLVAVNLHRELTSALSLTSQVCSIAEHLCQRNHSMNYLRTAAHFCTLNAAAARVDVAHYVAEVFLRNENFNLHHGLKQYGISLLQTVLQSHRTCNLERHLRGVDFVIRTVDQLNLEVYNFVSADDTALSSLADTGFYAADVFLRNYTADNSVLKFDTCARLVGSKLNLAVTILTFTTGLTNELAFGRSCLCDSLTEAYLRSPLP